MQNAEITKVKIGKKGAEIVLKTEEALQLKDGKGEVLKGEQVCVGDWAPHKDLENAFVSLVAFFPELVEMPKNKLSRAVARTLHIKVDDDGERSIIVSGTLTLSRGAAFNFNTPLYKINDSTAVGRDLDKLVGLIQEEGLLYVTEKKRTITQLELGFDEGKEEETKGLPGAAS